MSDSQQVAPSAGRTVVLQETKPDGETLILRLSSTPVVPPNERPHVTWAAGTVDNEHMGRLKSNCCCIYTRPRVWDDPTTWEQDEHETEHCRGHTLPPVKNHGIEENKDEEQPSGCHGVGCC